MSKFECFELYDCPVQGLLLLAGTDLKKVSGGEIGVFAVDWPGIYTRRCIHVGSCAYTHIYVYIYAFVPLLSVTPRAP